MTSKTRNNNEIPNHLQRYLINRIKIPHTHFSMLNEITLYLIAPLEEAGYTLPNRFVPDMSEGRVFSNWLRKCRKINPSSFPTYEHEYLDGRVFEARLYPNKYLEDFKVHFHEVWLPNYAPRYFSERDQKALMLLDKLFLTRIAA